MNNIVEILGSKKIALGVNTDVKTRVILTQPSTLNVESSLFLDINQDEQYVLEKTQSSNFRFYGSITPIINKQGFKKNQDKIEKINLDTKILNFTEDNWSVVLIKPTKVSEAKGKKSISNRLSSIDFSNGLPALPVKSQFNINKIMYKGLYFYLGHNFVVDDKIYIKSITEDGFFVSGIYTITEVNGNKIFTNEIYRISDDLVTNSAYTVNNVVGSALRVNNPDNVKTITKTPKTKVTNINQDKINVTVGDVDFGYFDNGGITNFISDRPSSYENIKPTLFVRKIVDNEILEYYVKTGVVVDVVDELDNCGFSLSSYGEQTKNYVFTDTIDTSVYVDNLNNPINHMYVGIVKNGSTTENSFSNVESNIDTLIEFTNVNEGYQIINTKSASTKPQKPKIGDEYIISICEYSTENLEETEICYFNHRFIHNDVLFHYNPFTKINLRQFSNYIETGDNVVNIPSYAVFSKKRDNYIWRDLYDMGLANENGDVIDFPFLNNSFYVFEKITFFLNIEKNKTLKYRLGQNDLSNIPDVSNLLNDFKSLTDNLSLTDTTEDPFKVYKPVKC